MMIIPPTMLQPRWPHENDCDAFYGDPRGENGQVDPQWYADNIVFLVPPFPMMFDGKPVHKISVHRKCATALGRVLDRVAGPGIWTDPQARIFAGSFNYRNIRGSTRLSMHAYGIAFDFAADRNPMGANLSPMGFSSHSPLVLAFLKEGAEWGGAWIHRKDPMHFQFARTQ